MYKFDTKSFGIQVHSYMITESPGVETPEGVRNCSARRTPINQSYKLWRYR